MHNKNPKKNCSRKKKRQQLAGYSAATCKVKTNLNIGMKKKQTIMQTDTKPPPRPASDTGYHPVTSSWGGDPFSVSKLETDIK